MTNRETRDVFGQRLVVGLDSIRKQAANRKQYSKGSCSDTQRDVHNKSVVFPPCSVCGGNTVSTTELRKYWYTSGNTIWKWVHKSKNPVPFQNAKYPNNPIANREGTHGITQLAFCIDHVNIWALQNGKKPAESWPEVLSADGTTVKLPPKPEYDHNGASNECFS